jgi:glycosyltransferase involved in cell wall biosynthesis
LDEKVKNPKGIIDSCSTLVREGHKDFHLTIISDEPFEKWKNYANQNLLSEHISFKGPMNWLELVPFYQKSDAFILFSSYETFSIVLAEAWACGIPTITTSVGIAKDLPSSLGIQIEVNNKTSLSNAMLEIMNGTTVFDSAVIQSHSEQYSGENVLSIYETLLDSIK